jgi:hypothetical protein
VLTNIQLLVPLYETYQYETQPVLLVAADVAGAACALGVAGFVISMNDAANITGTKTIGMNHLPRMSASLAIFHVRCRVYLEDQGRAKNGYSCQL